MNKEELIKENFLKKEQNYSKYATKSSDAIRLKEEKEDMRPAFFHDKIELFIIYHIVDIWIKHKYFQNVKMTI